KAGTNGDCRNWGYSLGLVRAESARHNGGVASRQCRRFVAARFDCVGARRTPDALTVAGRVSDSGEGRWTINAAIASGFLQSDRRGDNATSVAPTEPPSEPSWLRGGRPALSGRSASRILA